MTTAPISMRSKDLILEDGLLRISGVDTARAKLVDMTEGPGLSRPGPSTAEVAARLDLPAFNVLAAAYLDHRLDPNLYRDGDHFTRTALDQNSVRSATVPASRLAGQLGYKAGSDGNEARSVAGMIDGLSRFGIEMAGTRLGLFVLLGIDPGKGTVSFCSPALDLMVKTAVMETCHPLEALKIRNLVIEDGHIWFAGVKGSRAALARSGSGTGTRTDWLNVSRLRAMYKLILQAFHATGAPTAHVPLQEFLDEARLGCGVTGDDAAQAVRAITDFKGCYAEFGGGTGVSLVHAVGYETPDNEIMFSSAYIDRLIRNGKEGSGGDTPAAVSHDA